MGNDRNVLAVAATLCAFLAILAAAFSGAGCGLTADFSGLQAGVRDGSVADVGAAGPTDAGAADVARPAADAARDGGFCASLTTPVKFCDDFDEGQTVTAGWSSTDIYQGSSVLLDYTYYSPPASFLSMIDMNSSPASARLQEDLPIDTPHVHMEFELLLPQVGGGVNFELCALHEPVALGTTYGVFYKYVDGNLQLYVRTLDDDGGETDTTTMIGPPPSDDAGPGGDWLHVEIDTDISESATIVIKHDGVVVVDMPNVDTATNSRASMFVEVGYYSFMAASAIAHFDNVVVDWQ